MSIGDSKANKARLPPRRGRLRFPETGYKAAPRGYINLDEALDKLGRIRLPNEWDEFLRIKEFPFQYEREKRLTFQYKLIPKRGQYVISRTTIPGDDFVACPETEVCQPGVQQGSKGTPGRT